MATHLPLLLSSVLLIASPGPGGLAPLENEPAARPSDAEVFSALAGKVLGAASACKEIDTHRVIAAADRAAAMVSSATSDDAEAASAGQLFKSNAVAGQKEVQAGTADCVTVEASLTTL